MNGASATGAEEIAMNGDPEFRPGMVLLVCGVVVVGLSLPRVATGGAPGPGWFPVVFSNLAVGAGLGLWGWSRLRRAKAARPDLTWWQFLYADLIGLGLGAVLMAGFAAMPPEQRDGLVRSLQEFIDVVSAARGRP
jgi:hypothetical protein